MDEEKIEENPELQAFEEILDTPAEFEVPQKEQVPEEWGQEE